MPTQKTFPILERLKRLRAAFDQQPSVADDLVELLDWTPDEVEALLAGQVEPEQEDWIIIDALLKHLRQSVHANQDGRLAA